MKNADNLEAKNLRFGFIAQEVEKFLPSLVRTNAQGGKSLFYNDVIAILTMTLQYELESMARVEVRVEQHEVRITDTESRV